jgi:hypothetical protein
LGPKAQSPSPSPSPSPSQSQSQSQSDSRRPAGCGPGGGVPPKAAKRRIFALYPRLRWLNRKEIFRRAFLAIIRVYNNSMRVPAPVPVAVVALCCAVYGCGWCVVYPYDVRRTMYVRRTMKARQLPAACCACCSMREKNEGVYVRGIARIIVVLLYVWFILLYIIVCVCVCECECVAGCWCWVFRCIRKCAHPHVARGNRDISLRLSWQYRDFLSVWGGGGHSAGSGGGLR